MKNRIKNNNTDYNTYNNGIILKPTESGNNNRFQTTDIKNILILVIINMLYKNKPLLHIKNCVTVYKTWDKLKKLYNCYDQGWC